TIAKKVKRRLTSELRRLAVLLRRLIFLMALSMEFAPAASREGRNWFRPDDTTPKARRLIFRLAPAPSGPFPDSLRPVAHIPQPGPVDAAPVTARWHAMLDVLKHARRRATRLARTLQRWQATGVAKPYVLPMARTHRLTPELGLIAGAFTLLINQALTRWPDTG
ncbi:MAG: hypothetical protein KDA39_06605, partial [Hyphomonas sp.]|nr:hypothetical protein [Hyphomonas sp.]